MFLVPIRSKFAFKMQFVDVKKNTSNSETIMDYHAPPDQEFFKIGGYFHQHVQYKTANCSKDCSKTSGDIIHDAI